jgi:tetratricopeptide (TPR) repeat protein
MWLLVSDAALARRDFPVATETAQQVISRFPDRPGGYQRLGHVLADTGKFSEARTQFERALEIDPQGVSVLSDILQVMNAEHLPLADQVARVRTHLAAHPDNTATKLIEGQLLLSHGDFEQAIGVLEDAVKQDPNLLPAYFMLGTAYAKHGQLENAQARFETLLQHDKKAVPAYLMLGIIDELKGKTEEAAEQYRKALDVDPNAALAANNLAWHYAEREGKLDIALELAHRAKALRPDEPHVSDTLGWVLYKRGLYAAAIDPLSEAATKLSDNATVRYHLGMAYFRNGDKDKARVELTAALKLGSFEAEEEAKRTLREIEGTSAEG